MFKKDSPRSQPEGQNTRELPDLNVSPIITSKEFKPHALNQSSLNVSQEKRIFAAYDDQGLYVYQAFCPHIAQNALRKGTFGEGFGMRRMTWIKPSFGWMLYRSSFGEKKNQEAILRIKVSHEGFGILLRESALASFDPNVYSSATDWKNALSSSRARVQWDPDRDLTSGKIDDRRAIQIGISEALLRDYVEKWIVSIEDATRTAKQIQVSVRSGLAASQIQHPYPEREYPVEPDIMARLGMIVTGRNSPDLSTLIK